MTVPGAGRASGSCPAGCMAKVGLRWWRRMALPPTNGGSRWQKLTDTQRIILSAASQREDRGVELPANIQGKAAVKIVDKLIRAGLLEEVCANGSLPLWRRDDESGAIALRITSAGLTAIDAANETWACASGKRRPSRHGRSREIPAPKRSPPASGCPFRHGGPLARGIAPARRGLRPACSTKAGRAEAGSGAGDAGTTRRSDHCRHHAGDPLAAAFGARLFRRCSAQETRPGSSLGEGRR